MKKKTTLHWIVIFFLVLSLGLTACGNSPNGLNAGVDEEAQPEIDVDELKKDTDKGVVVTRVNADSPAEEVGMQKGDVVLMIGNQEVNNVDELREALEAYQEGDKVQVVIRRGNEIVMKTVELGAGPGRGYLGASVCCGGTMLTMREGEVFRGKAQAVILDVVPDSPAEKAGLEMGDVILAIDGSEIEYDVDLADVIQGFQPGDTLNLEVSREGETQEFTVTLIEDPDSAGTAYLGVRYQMLPGIRFISRGEFPGLHFEFRPGEEKRFRGVLPFVIGIPFGAYDEGFFTLSGRLHGILIASVEEDSPAEGAGLKPHDVITKLDGVEVEDIEDFSKAIRSHDPGDEVTLTITRSGEDDEIEIIVTLGEHPDEKGVGYLGVFIGGMIATEVIGEDGEEGDWPGPFHFHFGEFHHFDLPFGDDV
jgi:S1-C subfamily serine protease